MEIPNNTIFVHTGGGLGNVITEVVRGQMASRLAGLEGCCLWWRTKNPKMADVNLSSILDIDHLAKESKTIVTGMSNQQGWDFIHNEQLLAETKWERERFCNSSVAYSSQRKPNYFLVPTLFPMSQCRKINWLEVYRMIRPSPRLASIVDQSASKLFKGKVLGVHVRRTDRWREARISTDQVYFRMIDKMAGDYDTIFISTDEPMIERSFSLRYGGRLVHTGKPDVPKWSGFKTRKALVDLSFIEDAVVDMWLLSKCDAIIGSFKSSFSKVAARVSHNPDIKYLLAK